MSNHLLGVLLASIFMAGCMIIHASRGHAKQLTPHLLVAAMSLGLFVGLIALADRPHLKSRPEIAKPVEYPRSGAQDEFRFERFK